MIKRTYFYSGINKDTEKNHYGEYTLKSWFPNPKRVIHNIMDNRPQLHLQQFNRV